MELFGRLDLRSYPTSRAARERYRSPASSWTVCAVTCTTDLRSGPIFGIRLGASRADQKLSRVLALSGCDVRRGLGSLDLTGQESTSVVMIRLRRMLTICKETAT